MPEPAETLADDPFDRELLGRVHPKDWVNPKPTGRYHLVVVGGGTAGLVAAAWGAGAGARVALIERNLLGGDCLNVGCVPSKALLRAARAAADVRQAGDFGIRSAGAVEVDFAAVMARLRRLRADLAQNDSAARFRSLGVDVFLGTARFTGPDEVAVDGASLRFRRAIIAAGTRPATPSIPGLTEVGFLTNETVFNLQTLPRRLLVLGAGPIGCELAQAFARLGSQVTLVGDHPMLLPREDPDAAAVVAAALARDGVQLRLNAKLTRFERNTDVKIAHFDGGASAYVDDILVCTGRRLDVADLGLDKAGVDYDHDQVQVDDWLRTTNRRIFAAGDVCSRFRFTHAADAMARIAAQNALLYPGARVSALTIPWCTYTEPELAHVGLTAAAAAEQGIAIDTFAQEMRLVDRAVLDEAAAGFVKVHVRKGTDRIVGATAVAHGAAGMIAELTLAMTNRFGLKALARTIHPYPSQNDAVRKLGDSYNRSRVTPFVKGLLRRWFRWTA
jgi:pyruvate/2-oxoglutarate dehydrogenase complex dihydrolipoamide dehydrogenase (E3) component